MRTSIQKSQLVRIIKAIKIDIEHEYDMKRVREETTEDVPKTTNESVPQKRNEKNRIIKLAHNMARGDEPITPENLSLTGDISEYEAQHEIDESMWDVITDETKSMVTYPAHIKKYAGSVSPRGNRWQATVHVIGGSMRKYRNFDTREDAVAYVKKTSIEAGTVKNVIYTRGEDYYVALSQHQLMKISKESLSLVEEHIIYALYNATTKSYYAQARVNKKFVGFHTLMHKAEVGHTIDHINGLTLDNTLPNLRSVDWTIQCVNQRRKPTATGVIGVIESKRNGNTVAYVAGWEEKGVNRTKTFSISIYGKKALELAKEFREEKERTIPTYVVALGKKINTHSVDYILLYA